MNIEYVKKNCVTTILQQAVPAIIAMVLTSLITITDGFFVGNYVGKEGTAAINLGLPIVYLYLGIGLMVSVGGFSIAGRLFGAKENEQANYVFNQTIGTMTTILVILTVLMQLLLNPVMAVLGAQDAVANCFQDYYRIILFELPLLVSCSGMGMFIRGEGRPDYFMKISIINVLLNIVLDAVFTIYFRAGMKGIAFSSLLAAAIMTIQSIWYFVKKSKLYRFQSYHFQKEVFRESILNGSSEFIGEMSMCISMLAYNIVILQRVGVDGVAAFTIVGYLSYFFSMVIIGFGQGLVPLVSFTYGAKEYKLSEKLRNITFTFVSAAGCLLIIILLFTQKKYSTVFTDHQQIQQMIQNGIMIYMVSYPLSGINTITSFYYTSIGKAKESAIISSARGLVILLACILVLPMLWGMTGVWLVNPVTEFLTVIISIYFICVSNISQNSSAARGNDLSF